MLKSVWREIEKTFVKLESWLKGVLRLRRGWGVFREDALEVFSSADAC